LDLSYVTPRLIVLAAPAPAAGTTPALPRDAPAAVARLLRQRHGGRYRLYDLTGVKEGLSPDAALLGGAVETYRCDEPVPPLDSLAAFCEDADDFLRTNAGGAPVVLLCRDGVGRSGVFACAYLMHSGLAAGADAALAAFAAARSPDGRLALLPSQQRLLSYFAAQRTRLDAPSSVPLRLTEARIRLPANAVPPTLRIWQRNAATGAAELLPWSLDARVSRAGADALYAWPPSTAPLAHGDVKLELKAEARVGGAALGSAWLHTAFVTTGERLALSRGELDRPAAVVADDCQIRLLFAAAPQRAPSRPSSPAIGLALPPTGRPRTPMSLKGAAAATLAARALLAPGMCTPPRPSTPRGASPVSGSPRAQLRAPFDAAGASLTISVPPSPLSSTGEDTPRSAAVMQLHRNVEAARREAAAEEEMRRELHRCGTLPCAPDVVCSHPCARNAASCSGCVLCLATRRWRSCPGPRAHLHRPRSALRWQRRRRTSARSWRRCQRSGGPTRRSRRSRGSTYGRLPTLWRPSGAQTQRCARSLRRSTNDAELSRVYWQYAQATA
jgi:hypothetical protein